MLERENQAVVTWVPDQCPLCASSMLTLLKGMNTMPCRRERALKTQERQGSKKKSTRHGISGIPQLIITEVMARIAKEM